MRSGYIVSYDISDAKRWRKVYRAMYGFGDHIQLSVFRCELSPTDKVRMISEIDKLIHHGEDQVLVIDIGPVEGRADECIIALGKPCAHCDRNPVVV